MKRAATFADLLHIHTLMVRPVVSHDCNGGRGLVDVFYSNNELRWRCEACRQTWSPRVLDGLGRTGIAERFSVEVSDAPLAVPRLVFVTEGRKRYSKLTTDPFEGTPFSAEVNL